MDVENFVRSDNKDITFIQNLPPEVSDLINLLKKITIFFYRCKLKYSII